jgi:type I restriction enzyme S subunit
VSDRQLLFDRDVPNGWQVLKVDELKANEPWSCAAGPFGSNISSKYFVDEGIPVIRGSNLRNDLTQFVPEGFVFVSPERAATHYRGQHVGAGDLVFTCWGTLGQVGLIPKNGPFPAYIISNKQLKFRPNTALANPLYLFYYFACREMVTHINSIAIGAAVPGINLGILKNLDVVLPPLPTQRKIASILSAYDDLIENNTRRIAILEEMAQAIYREWFVNFRFPGHEHVKLVDSPLGQIPEGWETLSVDEVCLRITDGAHRSPKSVDDGFSMASMKDMEKWRLNLSTARKITQDDFDELVRIDCKPIRGDVLIAKDGASYLKYIFAVEEEQEVVLLSSVAILRPNGRLKSHLLAMTLNDPQTKGRLANYVTGAAIPRVILKDFKRFEIIVPPSSIQEHWWEYMEPLVRLIHGLLKKNDNLRTTRDLLLPKLISGQLDVEELDIDVVQPLEELEEATACMSMT